MPATEGSEAIYKASKERSRLPVQHIVHYDVDLRPYGKGKLQLPVAEYNDVMLSLASNEDEIE